MTVGLLFRFETRLTCEGQVSEFLEEGLARALEHLPVVDWLTMRFGQTTFGVGLTYSQEAAEIEHVGEQIAVALQEQIAECFAKPPTVEGFDVLANRVPA
jgi:hypothetical protein